MTPQEKHSLVAKVDDILHEHTVHELALGFLRYETVRKMNIREFDRMVRLNITGRGSFDDLVTARAINDQIVAK